MGKRRTKAGDNGAKPTSAAPSRLPPGPKAVALEGEERLLMERWLAERDLYVEQGKNIELRREKFMRELQEEADAINEKMRVNGQNRDNLITSKGFDVKRPVTYDNGVLTQES